MDAGTLDGIVKRVGPIPEIILGAIAYQVLLGLEYLHKVRRVIHRDIKPSNVLLNKQGCVKISDFGTSKQFDSSVVGNTSYVGTMCYMAVLSLACISM